jgi:hypothetical protein
LFIGSSVAGAPHPHFNREIQMVDSILEVLMRRDGMDKAEALERIEEAKQMVLDGDDPEEVVHYEFGLEPDYIWDLM